MGRLDGKSAVVTGSTSGIGAEIARCFAREGASVVVSGRREDRGHAVVKEITDEGFTAIFQQTDIADPEQCKRLIERAHQEFGRVDILVNNAGVFTRSPLEETSPEFWDQMFDVNLKGAFFSSQAAIPYMREVGGGVMINIGSGHAFGGSGSLIAYGVAKGALHTMTRKMAMLLAKDRIRVNWITVGWVLTEKEIQVQALEGRDRDTLDRLTGELPMGQMSTEDDIAQACLYLAADTGARITGTDILASAGLSIHM